VDDWRKNPKLLAILVAPAAFWLLVFFVLPLVFMFLLSFTSVQSNLSKAPAPVLEQQVGTLTDMAPVTSSTATTSTTEEAVALTAAPSAELMSASPPASSWTLDNYAQALQPEYLKTTGYSLWIAGLATLLCLAVGYPLAMAIAFASPKLRPLLLLLIILPFWTNLLVRTYALKSVLGAQGVVNMVWTSIPVLNLLPMPNMLYNDAGILIGLVYVHLPFMVLPLYTALEKLDRSYLEASLDLGAGQWRTFFSIMVPLTMPAIIAGCIITFIPAFGALVTPALMGGTQAMIGTAIENQIKSANNWPLGSALSLLLVYITFVILALQSWYSARKGATAK
jgi:spermidine/putrescine transport system permease protein